MRPPLSLGRGRGGRDGGRGGFGRGRGGGRGGGFRDEGPPDTVVGMSLAVISKVLFLVIVGQ